ncbi:hypothetical protein [Nevskia sp.]|uniref:hypothetical protein n=1 Tax=Nevskia sp. TaxID=1929292 RepID=UPI0025FBC2AE|nr:hypothetical protein [Nevskia sp.]
MAAIVAKSAVRLHSGPSSSLKPTIITLHAKLAAKDRRLVENQGICGNNTLELPTNFS